MTHDETEEEDDDVTMEWAGKTKRGFVHWEGKDRSGYPYSLQISSSADEECIWVGADEASCPGWPKCQHGTCELDRFQKGGGA